MGRNDFITTSLHRSNSTKKRKSQQPDKEFPKSIETEKVEPDINGNVNNHFDWRGLVSDIGEFLARYRDYEPKKLISIMTSLKHPSINYLSELFGYDRRLLKLVSWQLHCRVKGVTHESLNEYFWQCMDGIVAHGCWQMIKQWIDKIDDIQMEIKNKLKEVAEEYLSCYVCNINRVSVLYLPCGHLITCSSCHQEGVKHCHACNTIISESHVVYM